MVNKNEYIKKYSKEMKLPHLHKKVEEFIEYGEKKDLSYQEFLFNILNEEIIAKEGRKNKLV